MASSPLYADAGGDVTELMNAGPRLEKGIRTLTQAFATSPTSPLDGSLHPSLRADASAAVTGPIRMLTRRLTQPLTPASTKTSRKFTDEQVSSEERLFREAMREYESIAKAKYRTGINPEAKHTAKELEDVIADAVKKLQPADGGIWRRVEQAFQKLGESKDDVNSWLGLLPSESQYFSVVCGGLKLVVSAVARMGHVKNAVMESLFQIPFLLNSAQRVLAIYEKKTTLMALSRAFYVSILAAIGHILHYLRQKAAKQVLKVMLKPASFEKGLLAKVQAITTARDAFNAEADLCQKETLDEMAKATAAGNAEILDTLHAIVTVANREYSRVVKVLQEKCNIIEQSLVQIQGHLADVADTQSRQAAAIETQTETMKHIMELMRGSMQVSYTVQALYAPLDGPPGTDVRGFRLVLLAPKSDTKERVAACKKLLHNLDYDPSATSADLLEIYKMGPTMLRDDQERSVWVTRSEQLAAWVSSPLGMALFVNGGSSAAMRCSAMSFVCARLSAALLHMRALAPAETDTTTVVPLYHFCGEHISGGKAADRDTASGVANSLLAQLVTLCWDKTASTKADVKTNKVKKADAVVDVRPALALGRVKSGDVKSVLRRFVSVLQQLPAATTVYCILDGLSFYLDTQQTESAAEQLLRGLLRLTRPTGKSHRPKVACTFKLLLTAPYRFSPRVFSELADEEEVLNVPFRLPQTGGFTEMKWHLSMAQLLDGASESE